MNAVQRESRLVKRDNGLAIENGLGTDRSNHETYTGVPVIAQQYDCTV